jgi:hypothetical protein
LATHRNETSLAQELEVLRYVGLGFAGQLGQLADRQLVLGGEAEQTEPPRLPE